MYIYVYIYVYICVYICLIAQTLVDSRHPTPDRTIWIFIAVIVVQTPFEVSVLNLSYFKEDEHISANDEIRHSCVRLF